MKFELFKNIKLLSQINILYDNMYSNNKYKILYEFESSKILRKLMVFIESLFELIKYKSYKLYSEEQIIKMLFRYKWNINLILNKFFDYTIDKYINLNNLSHLISDITYKEIKKKQLFININSENDQDLVINMTSFK